ncbi:hypothetical protein Tco_0777007 [Tanacetum coccineum]
MISILVTPRVSALAGCDRLVSEPLVIEKTKGDRVVDRLSNARHGPAESGAARLSFPGVGGGDGRFPRFTPLKEEGEEPEKKGAKEAPKKGPKYEFLSYAVSDSDSDLESTSRSGP